MRGAISKQASDSMIGDSVRHGNSHGKLRMTKGYYGLPQSNSLEGSLLPLGTRYLSNTRDCQGGIIGGNKVSGAGFSQLISGTMYWV